MKRNCNKGVGGRQCIYIAREILYDTTQQADTGIAGDKIIFCRPVLSY